MMLKIFICLAIIIVIFIILNYCFSSQENFDEDNKNDNDEKYEVAHNETFDANNFYHHFLEIHDYPIDLSYYSDKQRIKHLLTGGLVDIYFRQLLNINMFYKDQILSGLDEASKSKHSFYMVTNMANFMYYDKMSEIYYNNLDYEGVNTTEQSLYPDFQNYFIIIKNPILKEMNSIRFGNIIEDLPSNIAIIKKNETIYAVPNISSDSYGGTTLPFNIINRGSDFENLIETLFDNMLVKLNNANYFRNDQDNHLGILYHLDLELNINEIYSYDFNMIETPSFLEETPDPNSVNNEFKYNWVLQSDNEVVKNVDYFEENSKSGFTLENLDIYDLFMKKYQMYTSETGETVETAEIAETYLIQHSINCDPETCDPATTNPDCKTRDEVFTDLFSKRAKEFPLFHFLSIYTNYITLDNLSGDFFKNQNKKLIPLLINYQEDSIFNTGTISDNNNFYSQMEEKNIFRVLLFYKIFKYDLYDRDQIIKISYLVIIFLFRNLREKHKKNQQLELFQEYIDRTKIYHQLSFVLQVENLEQANRKKKKIATVIQNMLLRNTESKVENLYLLKELVLKRNLFKCNQPIFIEAKSNEGSELTKVEETEPNTLNTKLHVLVDYNLKLKLYLEDSKLKVFLQLENITDAEIYPEELIYCEADDCEVVNYSSIKKLTTVNNEFDKLKIKLDAFIAETEIEDTGEPFI